VRLPEGQPRLGTTAGGSLLLLLALAGCEASTDPSASGAAGQPAAPAQRLARGQIRFVEELTAARRQAAEQRKPLLLFFTSADCHYCHQLADESFTHPQVMALAERFVCVLIDADAAPALCQQYEVQAFPTLLFLTAQGQPVHRMVGKRPPHQVTMAMQTALQNVALAPVGSSGPGWFR
jgi:thioredoxin-related protein